MSQHIAYRVVGVREGGEHVLISQHSTREGAETAFKLIKNCTGYALLKIEDAKSPKELLYSPLLRHAS